MCRAACSRPAGHTGRRSLAARLDVGRRELLAYETRAIQFRPLQLTWSTGRVKISLIGGRGRDSSLRARRPLGAPFALARLFVCLFACLFAGSLVGSLVGSSICTVTRQHKHWCPHSWTQTATTMFQRGVSPTGPLPPPPPPPRPFVVSNESTMRNAAENEEVRKSGAGELRPTICRRRLARREMRLDPFVMGPGAVAPTGRPAGSQCRRSLTPLSGPSWHHWKRMETRQSFNLPIKPIQGNRSNAGPLATVPAVDAGADYPVATLNAGRAYC